MGALNTIWLHGYVHLMMHEIASHSSLYVAVSTVKKWATDNGHAEKPEVMEAARVATGGLVYTDDNQADAYWLSMMARAHWMYSNGHLDSLVMNKYQRSAVTTWSRAVA